MLITPHCITWLHKLLSPSPFKKPKTLCLFNRWYLVVSILDSDYRIIFFFFKEPQIGQINYILASPSHTLSKNLLFLEKTILFQWVTIYLPLYLLSTSLQLFSSLLCPFFLCDKRLPPINTAFYAPYDSDPHFSMMLKF